MTPHERLARWRRPTIAAALLLALDQTTKTIAQFALDGPRIEVAPDWGLTYTVNPGTWLWPDISGRMLIVAHSIGILVWIGWLTATSWYRRTYRTSVTVDLATGFFTCAVFGNLLDRLLVEAPATGSSPPSRPATSPTSRSGPPSRWCSGRSGAIPRHDGCCPGTPTTGTPRESTPQGPDT